jgi:hypothetical protein
MGRDPYSSVDCKILPLLSLLKINYKIDSGPNSENSTCRILRDVWCNGGLMMYKNFYIDELNLCHN